jgi:hypothetical protein
VKKAEEYYKESNSIKEAVGTKNSNIESLDNLDP